MKKETKKYVKPEMKVYALNSETHLLAGSAELLEIPTTDSAFELIFGESIFPDLQ